MSKKIAIVTGSNKGIGFAIVRGLCKQFSGDVYLTSRDEGRGRAAVADLEKEGLKPLYHQLDLNDASSREKLGEFVKENYGGLDLLVNNAAIAYKRSSTAPFAEQAEVSMKTNYYDTLGLCDVLFPLLRPGARVVHVSSLVSHVSMANCSPALASQLKAASTIQEVSSFMQKFVDDVKAGNHEAAGWRSSAYGVTKVGITLVTPLQQEQFEKDNLRKDIVLNAACPGYVDTDMTSHKGRKTPDEGADTPLYLALLPPNTDIRGEFVSGRTVRKLP